jgi:membrane protein
MRRLGLFLSTVAQRFYSDNCLLHASALAYTALLSLVPLFALMFAVMKGLGVQRRLEPLLLSRLALDPSVVEQTIGYIDRTNVGTLGVLGALTLVFTVLSVLGSVEATFNAIWRIRLGRSWLRKATDYLSVVMLTPFLLLAAVAITSSVQEQSILRALLQTQYIGDVLLRSLRLAPVVFNIAALAVLYAVMPNRRPNVASVLLGAVVAGTVWFFVQWAYVAFQIGMAGYNAIYGALSQLPITLVWLYVSWAVVLLGAEIAAVYELGVADLASHRPASRRAVALHVLVSAARRFKRGGTPITPAEIARQLGADSDIVAEIFAALGKEGWIVPVENERSAYILARDPRFIELARLPEVIDTEGIPVQADAKVREALEEFATCERGVWQTKTLADLMDERVSAEEVQRESMPTSAGDSLAPSQ